MRNSFKEIPHIFVSNYPSDCRESSSDSDVEQRRQKNESLVSSGKIVLEFKFFLFCYFSYVVFDDG